MQFSVKWASVGGAYAGMLLGMVMMTMHGNLLFGLLGGAFMGGAIGLPLTGAQYASALLVKRTLASEEPTSRIGAFVLVSFGLYWAALLALDSALAQMGGLLNGKGAILDQMLFWLAGTVCSLICMALWGDHRPERGLS